MTLDGMCQRLLLLFCYCLYIIYRRSLEVCYSPFYSQLCTVHLDFTVLLILSPVQWGRGKAGRSQISSLSAETWLQGKNMHTYANISILQDFPLKRWEFGHFHQRYTSIVRDRIKKKNPWNHIVSFLKKLFVKLC